jgi:DNA-binding transcriptional regulator YiaG
MTGDQLRSMRMEMGWKQSFLANNLEVTRSSLAHWEQFRAPIPRDVSRRVAKAHRKMMKIVEELGL